jgi:hypothetical protein
MQGDIGEFARAIQLALAPAFLLSGIAALLNVMTGRLARIVDRGRSLVEGHIVFASPQFVSIDVEKHELEQRRHLTSIALTVTTIAALLVCVVIAGLFVEVMLDASLKWLISAVFAAAMLTLVVGLTFFLREVHLAMHTVRIVGPHGAGASAPPTAKQTQSQPAATRMRASSPMCRRAA